MRRYITSLEFGRGKMLKKIVIYMAVLLTIISFFAGSSYAQSTAEDYAPILYFEGEETCYPIDASYHIENSYLYEVDSSTPITTSPTGSTLGNYDSDIYQYYYLDNQLGTPDNPDGIINTGIIAV